MAHPSHKKAALLLEKLCARHLHVISVLEYAGHQRAGCGERGGCTRGVGPRHAQLRPLRPSDCAQVAATRQPSPQQLQMPTDCSQSRANDLLSTSFMRARCLCEVQKEGVVS